LCTLKINTVLFLKAGPVEDVKIPKDPNGRARGFGFITYVHSCAIPYAVQLYAGTKLYNREIHIKPSHGAANGRGSNNNQETESSHFSGPKFPNPFNPSLQGFNNIHQSNLQMMPNMPIPISTGGLMNNPLLDPNFLLNLGSQMLLSNPTMSMSDYHRRNNDLQKHSSRDRARDRRDDKPYSHHDRGRDNYRERDNRYQQNRDHRHNDRHDNRRRR
jgi:RNA recognition motif-containing protein